MTITGAAFFLMAQFVSHNVIPNLTLFLTKD